MAFGATLTAEVDSPSSRKARGAFFTPAAMADILCSWALQSRDDRMLDPACGEAEFLLSGMKTLRGLGAPLDNLSEQIIGCELHRASAEAAMHRCNTQGFTPTIRIGDFLDVRPEHSFDAVIGNPPYVRFQSIDDEQQKRIENVALQGKVHISALSSSWVPFVIHSSAFLKKGGRLAFVLPAELLTVNYAEPARSFLLHNFSEVTLALFDEKVFPEVQEEVVLLLASGYGTGESKSVLFRRSRNLADFSSPRLERFYPKNASARWSRGLVQKEALTVLSALERQGFCRLGEWGRIKLGAVTGNNGFFTLGDEQLDQWDLSEQDLIPISPSGSRHLRTLEFTEREWEMLRGTGKRAWLFYPGKELSRAAERYIQHGDELGVSNGYKCRNRSPWWRVPLTDKADAFLTYMNDCAPQLCANYVGVQHLNSVHGVVFFDDLRQLGMELLPLACINSATLLSSEIEGRAYGGGILKVEPKEATRLLVPCPEVLNACGEGLTQIRDEARTLLESGNLTAVCDIVDKAIGSAVPGYSGLALETLRAEKQKMYQRRRLRGKQK